VLAQQADCALWIPPQDPQALAEAIKDLRKQPELLDRYGSNGRKYVTVYFISENHVLWAWSETMALPVVFLSFARSDGVLENILPDTLHARFRGDSVCGAFRTFKTLLSIPDHYSSTPLLQQPRDLRARFWPPFQGAPNKATSSGRGFFTYKETHEALVISARDMADKEKKNYAKRKR